MFRLYRAFREAGGTLFDTAHCYCFWVEEGSGASERALGECLRRSGDREEVIVATKGGHPAGPGYPRPDRYLSPDVIASDIGEGLERLGVERIDLYYLHRDDPRVPVGEVLAMLSTEIARGRIRYLGASNWSTKRIAEANAHAVSHGLQGFVVSQPEFNLARSNKEPEPDPTMRALSAEDVQWHREQQMPVVAYSSTACGYFATAGQVAKQRFDNPISRSRLHRAQQLASELGCTPNQIALAYLMHQEFPVVPIVGTMNLDHLNDALQSVSVTLTPQQICWLRDGSPS